MPTYNPETLSPMQVQRLLHDCVAPRPIAFASTIDLEGKPNLSPFSFFNAFGVNPTTLIFSPSKRGRDGSTKDTYQNVKEVPEVVINMVTYDMVEQVNLASTEYPKGVNEFEKAGFTALQSETIRPFRVAESPVQLECKVRQVIETGEGGGSANLVICEVLRIHVKEGLQEEDGSIKPDRLRLVGRMGGNHYVKAFGEGIFQINKPVADDYIGIDKLPENIKYSPYLNGNELGLLGMSQRLPNQQEITAFQQDENFRHLFPGCPEPSERVKSFHLAAKEMIARKQVWEALCLLLS